MYPDVLGFVSKPVLECRRQWLREPIRQEDAKECADQRRSDLVSDLLHGPVDSPHGYDDPQDGCHDAKCRQGISNLVDCAGGFAGVLVVDL